MPAPPLPGNDKRDALDTQTSENVGVGDGKELEAEKAETKGRIKYPYFVVHPTPEEAAAETKLRADSAPPYPESELRRAWAKKQASAAT